MDDGPESPFLKSEEIFEVEKIIDAEFVSTNSKPKSIDRLIAPNNSY